MLPIRNTACELFERFVYFYTTAIHKKINDIIKPKIHLGSHKNAHICLINVTLLYLVFKGTFLNQYR